MIIAFSGIDGSGKTTYAGFVMNYFKSKKLKCKYRHIIRDSFYHLILHNFIGRISKSSQRSLEVDLRNPNSRVLFFIFASIKKILLFINLLYFNIRYLSYWGNSKNSIICDRYFYDEIVQMLYLKLAGKTFISLYKDLIIEPDIAFFIKVKPEVAYSRKDEYDKNYFIEKTRFYEQINKPAYMVEIPADSIENNKDLIFAKLAQRLKSI